MAVGKDSTVLVLVESGKEVWVGADVGSIVAVGRISSPVVQLLINTSREIAPKTINRFFTGHLSRR
jgi:hypothetical protein